MSGGRKPQGPPLKVWTCECGCPNGPWRKTCYRCAKPKWDIAQKLAAELNDTIQAERHRRKRKAVT